MKTAMQELIVHLEMLKSRVDMADIDSLIEYATTSLEKEKEQIILSFFDGATYEGDKKHIPGRAAYDYYDRYYNQNK